ncbi:MAG TPA: segregation/condensation protein A [Lachnospiraceae bacterium]|nr:segregation/condensation protein A [Lachnospiraceae bacterium]
MAIPVKLEVFEGPLDLLLHLIEKNKVDIYDIPIVMITDQYLEYVSQMQNRNMDVMSEFLVMAATLLRIKSKMLLPPDETEDGEEEIDPRQELVERLLEYKLYKYASFELKDRQVDAGKVFYKEPTIPDEVKNYDEGVDFDELLSEVTLSKLQEIFDMVMQKQEDKIDPIRSKFGEIEKEEINIEDQMIHVEEYAMLHGRFSFRQLLEERRGKDYLIVTFLSVLELMKTGVLKIVQESLFSDIEIAYQKAS